MYKPKSDYFDFRPVGVGDKVDIYLPERPRVSFRWNDSVGSCNRLRNLHGRVTDEYITYPYIVLNDLGYTRWLVASCPVGRLNTHLREMDKNAAPLPYRVVVTTRGGKAYLYWCLNKDIKVTPFRSTREEKRLRETYVNFCNAFRLTKERYHGLVNNPCYISNATGKVDDRECTLNDFSASVMHRRDRHYYHDAYDYLYKSACYWACKRYRDNRPTADMRHIYENMILGYIETIDITEWPEAVNVSYEDMAVNIAKYLFTQYDDRIDKYTKLQSIRGSLKGRARRNVLGEKARELSNKGHSYGEISKELGVPRSTIATWLKRTDI